MSILDEGYIEGAMHNFRRAARLLVLPNPRREDIEDALLFFSFGVERIFKAIVERINPVFLLESAGFENAFTVLYRDKLIGQHRVKADKEFSRGDANTNVLPFKGSMLRAAKFSKTVEDNIGAFTKLSDLRGIVAHRPLSQLSYGDAFRTAQKHFHPTVVAFAQELDFSADECFNGYEAELRDISDNLIKEANIAERLDKRFEEHRTIWEKNSGDSKSVERAKRETQAEYKRDRSGSGAREYCCPACENPGVLFIEADWDVEGSGGEGFITGVYVARFACRFCELEIDDFEEIDFLKMNEVLHGD